MVISIYGGSGSGKTTLATALQQYFFNDSRGCYLLSGDDYPHRIPKRNDEEQLRVYKEAGEDGLRGYLGTKKEIDFARINEVLSALHEGKDTITLRNLEREDGEISSEETDFPEYLYCFWSGRTEAVTIYMVWIYPSFWKVPRRRQRSGASAETASRMPQARLSAVWWNWNRKNSKCSAKMQDVFSSFYILPSLYHSDLDRGFSVIDYDLNEQLADREDLDQLKNMGINLKLDFILNHASAQSPQFRDLVEKGEASAYRDFFIDWNHFWEGHGRQYLGQMDVNIQSPKVWEFYRETLEKIASYGAAIVRLDAFAYAPKTPGKKNFLNDPETWELLQKIHALAEPLGLTLLPEIHAAYDEKIYETLAEKGYATYDFFLPGLVIDAIENRRGTHLAAWAKKIVEKKISTVNMLGCYDGIPLLDLKGLLPKEEIERQF